MSLKAAVVEEAAKAGGNLSGAGHRQEQPEEVLGAPGHADPVEAIKFRMEQEGLTPRDLEPYIGPSGRVSEVLNRKRPLSLRMVKRLHDGLKIPYESLLAEVS
jgi:antitoxin component HigA of HigAB toxin-antitoxin module